VVDSVGAAEVSGGSSEEWSPRKVLPNQVRPYRTAPSRHSTFPAPCFPVVVSAVYRLSCILECRRLHEVWGKSRIL
jgi:hypothetical protein